MSSIVIWQCIENPAHRGWRDESNPAENMRRGTCDRCLAQTAFEREVGQSGDEEVNPRSEMPPQRPPGSPAESDQEVDERFRAILQQGRRLLGDSDA